MKKKISLLLVAFMLFTFMPQNLVQAKTVTAVKSSQKFAFTRIAHAREDIDIDSYLIEGSNYVKLRDVAAVMVGQFYQFSVSYDATKNLVMIEPYLYYEKQGTDLAKITKTKAKAILSDKQILLGGEEREISTAFINGNNYMKLRDIANLIGFLVDYDNETRTVLIATDTEEGQEAKVVDTYDLLNDKDYANIKAMMDAFIENDEAKAEKASEAIEGWNIYNDFEGKRELFMESAEKLGIIPNTNYKKVKKVVLRKLSPSGFGYNDEINYYFEYDDHAGIEFKIHDYGHRDYQLYYINAYRK